MALARSAAFKSLLIIPADGEAALISAIMGAVLLSTIALFRLAWIIAV
jgi:hypothetical protein